MTTTAPSPNTTRRFGSIRNLPKAYSSRGLAYDHKGDLGHADPDYNEAIRLDPKYAQAYFNRGNAYYQKGDDDRAIADYSEAIRLDPKYAYAYNNRGTAYDCKGDDDRAISDYNEAICSTRNMPRPISTAASQTCTPVVCPRRWPIWGNLARSTPNTPTQRSGSTLWTRAAICQASSRKRQSTST